MRVERRTFQAGDAEAPPSWRQELAHHERRRDERVSVFDDMVERAGTQLRTLAGLAAQASGYPGAARDLRDLYSRTHALLINIIRMMRLDDELVVNDEVVKHAVDRLQTKRTPRGIMSEGMETGEVAWCGKCSADPELRSRCLDKMTCQGGKFFGDKIAFSEEKTATSSPYARQLYDLAHGGTYAAFRDPVAMDGVGWCRCPNIPACLASGQCQSGQFAGSTIAKIGLG
jgi:hypothetical protein